MSADVTSTFSSLSSTESSNSPSGTTAVGANLDDNLRMIEAHLAAWRDQIGWGVLNLTTVAGTNTITATLATAGSVTFGPTALSTGMRFRMIPANSNTGATTLNITSPNGGSSLSAKSIFLNGAALVGYELRKNCPVILDYDGTQFNIVSGAHGGDGNPLGTVLPFTGSTAPNSYLLGYGQAVSRTTYADYFALVGTTYGTGDGSTTFNVPDFRGRVLAGKDDMGGSAASRLTSTTITSGATTLGNSGGEQTHTLVTAEIPSHTHSNVVSNTPPNSISIGGAAGVYLTNGQTGSAGGDGAHNNVQPTIIVNYIIKI